MNFLEIFTCIYMAVIPDGIPAIINLIERKKRLFNFDSITLNK